MGRDVRFIVFSTDEAFTAEIRATLLGLSGGKVVAEVDELAMLSQAAQQFPADVILANLDPVPDSVLPMIGEVAAASPEVPICALSESTDGQLILKAMRTGVREFIPKPVDQSALQEAVDRIVTKRAESKPQGKVVAVVGASGGMGATMIATNLAVELAAIASRGVTVVDLDYRFGQVATLLDVDPRYTIADLCSSPEALEEQVISKALTQHETGVQVLSRPNLLSEAESITAAACTSVFAGISQFCEYVVADGPTRFDPAGKSVLALADEVFLVVQQIVSCVRNGVRIIDDLRNNGFNLERAKIICNRAGRKSGHLSVDDVVETLGLDLYATLPDDWETASGAINIGEPLISYSPKSRLRVAIQELAERLHKSDEDEDADKDAPKQGLIGRIFAG